MASRSPSQSQIWKTIPGLWLRGNNNNSLSAHFPPYPLKETLNGDRNFRVTEAADYIAVTRGKRSYPWRLLAIAEKDGDLITNQLVYLLQKPSQLKDTAWIKPGKGGLGLVECQQHLWG